MERQKAFYTRTYWNDKNYIPTHIQCTQCARNAYIYKINKRNFSFDLNFFIFFCKCIFAKVLEHWACIRFCGQFCSCKRKKQQKFYKKNTQQCRAYIEACAQFLARKIWFGRSFCSTPSCEIVVKLFLVLR